MAKERPAKFAVMFVIAMNHLSDAPPAFTPLIRLFAFHAARRHYRLSVFAPPFSRPVDMPLLFRDMVHISPFSA